MGSWRKGLFQMPRLKNKFAALICNREGGKSQAKIGDVVQVLDVLVTMMSEEYLKNDSDFVRTEVVDFLEMDARKKFRKLRHKERSVKARKK
jgi:hypothetical protein